VKRAVECDRHRVPPILEGHVLEEDLAALGGVEDEDVNFAEALHHAFAHRAYRSGVRDVGGENLGIATRCADLLHHRFGIFTRAQRVDRNGCSCRSERDRDRASDILRAPGDERNLACELAAFGG